MFNFNRQDKPMPTPILTVDNSQQQTFTNKPLTDGIFLGNNCYWNPDSLPNGHIVVIGASGRGKTKTLKVIAYSLKQTYPDT
jgi:type IV secretory pathway VirB4 component